MPIFLLWGFVLNRIHVSVNAGSTGALSLRSMGRKMFVVRPIGRRLFVVYVFRQRNANNKFDKSYL